MTNKTKLILKVLSLGTEFEFDGTEVPEKINFGGAQLLNIQKLVGGDRVVDAMGADDAALTWSGIFFGEKALARAQFLDQVRRSGAACTLQWENFLYTVIISEFKADFNKSFWISYAMTCQVVRDQVSSARAPTTESPGDALNEDGATATQLANQIGAPSLITAVQSACAALSAVTAAVQPIANGLVSLNALQIGPQIGQVSTLSTAASAAIQAAGAPLAALQSAVQNAIAAGEATVAALPALGYIDPALPMAQQVMSLVTQGATASQLPALYQLSAVTTRMQANLALVADPSGNNQVVIGGGSLYHLAAQTYGDATRWTDIAQASGIADPMTVGFKTVTVPQ